MKTNVLYKNANQHKNQHQRLKELIAHHQEQEADELSAFLSIKRNSALTESASFRKADLLNTIIITPVDYRCNLNCDYCFNSPGHKAFSKNKAIMSEQMLSKIIWQAMSISNNLVFVWHGGEPLLAGIDFYEKALKLQKKYASTYSRIRNVVQTNATLLTEKWINFFKKNNFEIGISLDGPKKIHDSHRKYPSQKGSFNNVMRAIKRLNLNNKSFGVISVINKNNFCSPEEFLDFFVKNNLHNLSVNPDLYVTNSSVEYYADFVCQLFDLWLDSGIDELKINLLDSLIKAFLGYRNDICWLNGNCHKIIRVDQEGSIWPCCDRYLPYKEYNFGNIEQNSLKYVLTGRKYQKFKNNFGTLPKRCSECKWNHICRGGCTYHRLINGGGKDGGDHFCQAYQQILNYVSTKYNHLLHQQN